MNATLNESNAQCQLLESIANFPLYRIILIAECILSALAAVPNAALIPVVWKVSVLPSNLRLLMAHLSFVFVWFAAGAILQAAHVLARSSCTYALSMRRCLIFKLGTIWLSSPNIFYSLIPLCVERLYATIGYRTYGDSGSHKKPWLATCLIPCTWITALIINGRTLFSLPDDQYVPICGVSLPQTTGVSSFFTAYLSLEVIAALIVAFVYIYNRYMANTMTINTARYNLAARFQIDQNVKVNAVVVPAMILHVVFHLPTLIMLCYGTPEFLSDQVRASITQFNVAWRLIYGFIHPIMAFQCSIHLRQHLAKTGFGKALKRVGIRLEKETTIGNQESTFASPAGHIKTLHQIWEVASKSMRLNQVKPAET